MQRKQNKPGYILILAVLLTSALVVICTNLFYRSTAFVGLSSTIIQSQQAKQAALASLQLGISRLSLPAPAEANTNVPVEHQFLTHIFPIINTWHEYKFTEEESGFDGTAYFAIASEAGKFNINEILKNYLILKNDSKTGGGATLYIESLKKIFKNFGQWAGKEWHEQLLKFFDERKYYLNDTSELLDIPSFSYFSKNLFFDYPKNLKNENRNFDDYSKPPIYLMDVFTIFSQGLKLQPFMISKSVQEILNFHSSEEQAEKLAAIEKIISWEPEKTDPKKPKSKKDKQREFWENTITPLYGVSFDAVDSNVIDLMDPMTKPYYFSITATAKVGDITKSLYAILQLRIIDQDQVITHENITLDLVKLYWIS